QLGFRAKTLQSADQARVFQEGMLNTGAVSIGTRITQQQFDALAKKAGAFQAAEGGDAATHGTLVGQLPALMRLRKDPQGKEIPATADEVMGQEAKLWKILGLGGSTFSSSVRQLM